MEHRMLPEEGHVHLCLLVGIDLFRFDACTCTWMYAVPNRKLELEASGASVGSENPS